MDQKNKSEKGRKKHVELVFPGDVLSENRKMRPGMGTTKEASRIITSTLGIVHQQKDEREKKNLGSVNVFKSIYRPRVGDLVIAEIISVEINRWYASILGMTGRAMLSVDRGVSRRIDPYSEDIGRIYRRGDIIAAKINTVSLMSGVSLETVSDHRELGKLEYGRLIQIDPSAVTRLLGRKGATVQKMKESTDTQILVGRNGSVWIRGPDREAEQRVIDAIEVLAKMVGDYNEAKIIEPYLKER